MAFARIASELTQKNITGVVDAYFACVLCLCFADGSTHSFEGRVDGTITFPPRGEKGFGYDPIFIPQGYNVTFAQIPAEEKNKISHRARAFEKLLAFLEQ